MQDKIKPAAIAGLALGFASGVPIVNLGNCACCAWVIGGGVLAAYLFLQNAPRTGAAPYGDAALLGLLTGTIGAVVAQIVQLPFTLLFNSGDALAQLSDVLAEQDVPPEVQEMIASIGSGGGGCISFAIGLVFGVVVFSIFATAGTMIGTAIFFKPQPPATSYPSTPSAPPPPPPTA